MNNDNNIPNELISIAIPTCNRIESLKEALGDLISKIKKHNIKIFISDNNSQDGTEDYIKELSKEYPFIHYYKVQISDYTGANVSISAEKNIKQSLELSDTKYTLLLGDHYILYDENSIDTILSYLDKDFDALILRHKNRIMAKNDDYIYTNKDMFIEEFGWYISMVSTTIYSNQLIKKLKFEKYYHSNFAHTLAMLDFVSNGKFKIQYINKETTWTTKGGVKGLASWHSKALDIFTKSWYKGIMSLPNTFSKRVKLKSIKNHANYCPGFYYKKSLILYRYAGGLSLLNIIKNFKYFYFISNLRTVLLSILISFVPKKLIKYLFKEEYKYIIRVLGEIDEYNNKIENI